MKKKEFICIVCPNGCLLEAEIEDSNGPLVRNITGQLCDRGPAWAEQELINPMRTIAGNIAVIEGNFPLVSVKTDSPVPLGKILDVVKEIRHKKIHPPVRIGDILIKNVAGTSSNIVATRNVDLIKQAGEYQ